MADDVVTKRECDIMHSSLNDRLDKIDGNFNTVFVKLDVIAGLNGKVEFSNQKIEALGKKFDGHIRDHGKFITWSFAIIALVSTLVTVISFMLKH